MRFEDHNQQHGSSADAGAILNLSTAKPRGLSAVWPRGGLGSGAAGGASDWGSSNGGGGAAGGSTPPLTGLKLKLWEKQQKKAARGDGLSSLLISGFLSLAGWLARLSLPPSLPPSLFLSLSLSRARGKPAAHPASRRGASRTGQGAAHPHAVWPASLASAHPLIACVLARGGGACLAVGPCRPTAAVLSGADGGASAGAVQGWGQQRRPPAAPPPPGINKPSRGATGGAKRVEAAPKKLNRMELLVGKKKLRSVGSEAEPASSGAAGGPDWGSSNGGGGRLLAAASSHPDMPAGLSKMKQLAWLKQQAAAAGR
jgi:hypothetical protein